MVGAIHVLMWLRLPSLLARNFALALEAASILAKGVGAVAGRGRAEAAETELAAEERRLAALQALAHPASREIR